MGKRYSILDNSKIGKIFRDDAVDSINFSFHAGVFVNLKWSWTRDYISLTIIALVTSTKNILNLQSTFTYADLETGLRTPLSPTHLYSPRCDRPAAEITKVFPVTKVLPSATLIQDSCAAGLPVALQDIVTFLLSFSKTVTLQQMYSIVGETKNI